jgi:hypothetical protein
MNQAFSSLGFVFASPERFVEPLLEATPGTVKGQVNEEAAVIHSRGVE